MGKLRLPGAAVTMGGMPSALFVLNKEVINCARCPRLVAYREQIGREKRRAYRDHEYWARPVPGFGDPQARVLVLGLAPGAHGSNRTGRPFTGDASGKFMYPILYKVGFANQPTADHRDDGLKLLTATSRLRFVARRLTTSRCSRNWTTVRRISIASWPS